MDEINRLDSCAVPQLKVLTIKFPLRQKRFDSYWSNRPAAAFEQEQLSRKQDRSGISSLGRASACQDSCDMGKAMSIGQLLNLGVRRGGHTFPNSLTAGTLNKHVEEIPKCAQSQGAFYQKDVFSKKKAVRPKNKAFAHLKYSNDDHGGFKAAAARPHPHLHHKFSDLRLPQLFSRCCPPNKITFASFNIQVVRPNCSDAPAPHAGQLETARGSRKRGSSTAAPTCSRAQLLPSRSWPTTLVPLWSHHGSTMVPLLSSCFPCSAH